MLKLALRLALRLLDMFLCAWESCRTSNCEWRVATGEAAKRHARVYVCRRCGCAHAFVPREGNT